jgi:PAS domain S-box-containing protein
MIGSNQQEYLLPLIGDTVGGAGIGICICELDGTIYYINRTILDVLGIVDMPDISAVKKISGISDVLFSILESVKSEKAIKSKVLYFRTKPDQVKRFVYSAFMIDYEDKGFCFIIMVNFDNYQSLVSDEYFYNILDNLEEAYYEVDLAGDIIYASKTFCAVTGQDCEEIIGKNYSTFFGAEDAQKIYQSFNEAYFIGKSSKAVHWVGLSKGKRSRMIEVTIIPVMNETKKITGFRGIIRDITEKDRFEKELIRARKLEAIGILSGGIAHDYNNALTAILGNISLAKMEVGPENTSLNELLNEAEEASLKAVELTRRLSTFARGGKPERSVIDYSDSLRGTVDSVLNGYRGICELNIQDGLWKVDIDEFQINQVVTNLLNNALEAMSVPRRIRISADNVVIEQEESHLEITLKPGNYVRIAVSDEGSGIQPDDLHRIFDPYFTTKEMASGMGLTTSYAIIKRHYGYIDVKSGVGEGSTFYLYLPIAGKKE